MEDVKRHELGKNELAVYSPEEVVLRRVLRGRIFIDSDIEKATFVETQKRGARSKLLERTLHGTMRRSADGEELKITLRFKKEEKFIKEHLLSEVRFMVGVLDGVEPNRKGGDI